MSVYLWTMPTIVRRAEIDVLPTGRAILQPRIVQLSSEMLLGPCKSAWENWVCCTHLNSLLPTCGITALKGVRNLRVDHGIDHAPEDEVTSCVSFPS